MAKKIFGQKKGGNGTLKIFSNFWVENGRNMEFTGDCILGCRGGYYHTLELILSKLYHTLFEIRNLSDYVSTIDNHTKRNLNPSNSFYLSSFEY